ncbi:hypothetical protein ACFOEQ_25715 [Chryseobacterium arachidis]|uniref:hypothetical protein n=1 Tax=Chryseobacterium arachidis TaxID=1416778 RepID=UPI00362266B8
MTKEANNERKAKILEGLEKAYEKMLDFKRKNNSELVVIRENKIVKINHKIINIKEKLSGFSLIFCQMANAGIFSLLKLRT